ncbi:hypothetical protein N7478_006961 [Penicillium angulare]|uniref:uncharacterized protein n=1 Tax=Penicillium angulare TaxID=116970 RepID=UPI002541BC24|nr:uncharacterized protein N7478_006961 [Penicillium angulare]KAJ5281589.1 hypothetical protein N7478_006961 [Penicillium angulare]
MADETHQKRGMAETLDICKAEPPTTDIDTLDILLKTLQKMGGHAEERSMLWEKAAKAKPQDHELQMRWFTFAFDDNDWKSAQKATMSLQKNFPRERKYYFWAIFCSHMLATDDRSSEMDRKLFGTLAYRMASKAAADVPSDPAQLLSQPRAIQKSEELLLLVKIFESQKRFDEVVKILDSENLGIKSRICQNDTHFIALKAENLGASHMWEEAISFVKEYYTVPEDEQKQKQVRDLDDWVIWNLLVEAVKHLETPGTAADMRKFVESFIEFNPKSRNATLARLEIIKIAIKKGEMTIEDDLLPICQQYIDQHKGKLYAFNDLRRILDGDKEVMAQMLKYLSENVGEGKDAVVPTINSLKLDYCLNVSAVDNPSKQKLEELVTRCMSLYQSSATNEIAKTEKNSKEESSTIESQPRDDLCILAAMAILSGNNDQSDAASHASFVRAAAVLERLIIDSPHNYQALLMLVRIYLLFGAGSLAFGTFNKLSVKQMQYESVAHNFFTRLATIHPHSAPPTEGIERKEFDPQAAFIQCLNFFRTADLTTMSFRTRGLEEGSYINVEEIVELRKRLSNSICRRLYALDARRAQRLVGGDPLGRFDEIARNDAPIVDGREYSAFMSCEFPGQPDFERYLRPGPAPSENWLSSARITDQLFDVLKGIAIQKPLTPEMDLPDLSKLYVSEPTDQTEVEKETSKIHSELLRVATFMAGSKSTTTEQADKALSEVEDWLNAKKRSLTLNETEVSPLMISTAICLHDGTPTAATWEYLHAVFTLLETLKALSLLVASASRKSSKSAKLSKERVDRLTGLMSEVFELSRSNTRALKQRISAPGVLSSMVDLMIQGSESDLHSKDLQEVLESSLGTSELELFCGSLMESWEEALDGVMRVKL